MAAPEPAEPPNIGDLPAALFGRILSLAGSVKAIGCAAHRPGPRPTSSRDHGRLAAALAPCSPLVPPPRCRPSVTLVSHAWRNAFFSEPALWSSFRLVFPSSILNQPAEQHPALRTAWLAARLQLLRLVAPHLTALEIRSIDGLEEMAANISTAAPVAHIFELLNPASLERLELGGWTAMPPRLLARFPALRSLGLQEYGCDRRWNWPPPVLEALCSMRQLTELTLVMWGPQPQLLAAIADCLPQLQRLSASSRHPLPHAERLTRLTALQHLELCEVFSYEGMRPPAPAQLPSLQTYQLAASHVSQDSRCGVLCVHQGGRVRAVVCLHGA